DGWSFLWHRGDGWRTGCHGIGTQHEPVHLVAYATIDEARELVDRVIGAAARGIDVQRIAHGEVIARPSHRDVHEAAFLLELIVVVQRARKWEVAVDRPREKHGVPLLALGAVRRAEHQ